MGIFVSTTGGKATREDGRSRQELSSHGLEGQAANSGDVGHTRPRMAARWPGHCFLGAPNGLGLTGGCRQGSRDRSELALQFTCQRAPTTRANKLRAPLSQPLHPLPSVRFASVRNYVMVSEGNCSVFLPCEWPSKKLIWSFARSGPLIKLPHCLLDGSPGNLA